MLKDFVAKFTEKEISYIKIGNKCFMENKTLEKSKLEQKEKYFGVYLGQETETEFLPAFGLLDWLSENSKEKVFVKDMAEIDFLYGKNLRARHIDHVEGETKIGYLKLVQNLHDENLGYAKISGDFTKTQQVLKHKLDRGIFLKREKKQKEQEAIENSPKEP